MDEEHDALAERFARLEGRLEQLERRLDALARAQLESAGPLLGQQPPPPTGAPLPPPAAAPVGPLPMPDAERLRPLPDGATVLRVTGLVLMFLAVVFGISTAIDRGWIGPELQLALAVAFGLTLWAGALRPPAMLAPAAFGFTVAGAWVLFAAAGGGRDWLELYDFWPAFLGWAAVAIASLVMARLADRELVSLLILPALLFTLLWTRAPRDLGDLGFATVVTVVALAHHALGIDRGWLWTSAVTAFFTGLIHLGAAGEVGSDRSVEALVLVGGQALIVLTALAHWYAPTLILHAVRGGGHPDEAPVSTDHIGGTLGGVAARAVLGVPLWAWGTSVLLHDLSSGWAALTAAVVAAVTTLLVGTTCTDDPHWMAAARFGAVMIVAGAGFAVWLEGSTLLAALALIALALLIVEHRLPDEWLAVQGQGLALLVVLAAGVFTLRAIDTDAPWGDDAVHAGIFVAVLAAGLLAANSVLVGAGYVALLGWLASVLVHLPQGQFILSISWAVLGVGLVLAGLGSRTRHVAQAGAATLAAVVAKMITVDLAEIDTFWRAGLFLGVGAGLLWLSARIARLDDHDEPGADQLREATTGS